MNGTPVISYWRWLFKGSGAGPGYRRVLNLWLILHVAIGVTGVFLVPGNLKSAANSVLLPMVGILIGLTFAWAGNAQTLLQSEEIAELAKYRKGGFEEYVYTYQLAILAILVTLILWGLAGLSVFDCVWPMRANMILYDLVKGILFAACSVTIRECWHVVLGAQLMLLVQKRIRENKRDRS